MRQAMDLVDIGQTWLGSGFKNQARQLRVREDADPDQCKKALEVLVRHLLAGQIASAADDGIDVEAIFETVPDQS